MEAGGTSTRKRKSAELDDGYTTPAPAAATGAADPGSGEDDGGGVREEEGDLDRISSLPDAILQEIISLLLTRQGARSQILASRWRHLGRSAPLNLDCRYLATWDKLRAVILLIFSSHQGPGRRFCTSSLYTIIDIDAVEACLLSPALDNLQELAITSWMGQPMPASVNRFSSTLCVVHMGHCSLDVTVQGIHFPLLKQLELVHSTISECSLHRMIAGCPSLECLLICCCTGVRCLRINSPVLTSIGVSNYSRNAPMLEEIVIESAPRLETFLHLHQYRDLHVTVLSAPKLEILGCTNSTRLMFGSTTIQGPHIVSLAMVVCTVKCLALSMPTLSLDMVIQMMRCFPCLEKLYIQCKTSGENNLWRRKHRDLLVHLDIRLKIVVLNYYRAGQKI
ncbi:unnamed protein product [Alopecurus aequalis]